MKAMLFALRFNELLDFVRRNPPASPDLPPLMVSFNICNAAWRFI
jgi:hypothetical protein